METRLTDLEIKLLNNIAYDEMTAQNGAQPESVDDVRCYLWADERASALGISEQAVGGVLTSLQKKGLIGITAPDVKLGANVDKQRFDGHDPDGGVWFTDAGFAAWQTVDNPNYWDK